MDIQNGELSGKIDGRYQLGCCAYL